MLPTSLDPGWTDRQGRTGTPRLRDAHVRLRPRDQLIGTDIGAEFVECAPHQPQVNRADHVLVIAGHLEERTSPELHAGCGRIVGDELRFEAELTHQLDEALDRGFGRDRP